MVILFWTNNSFISSLDIDRDYANYVDDNGVAEVQALEKAPGKRIMAYPTPPQPAAL